MRWIVAATNMLLVLGFLGQPLLAQAPSNEEISEGILALQNERQDLLSRVEDLEEQIEELSHEIQSLEQQLRVQEQESLGGIRLLATGHLNVFSGPAGWSDAIAEINRGDEFLVVECAKDISNEVSWWEVSFQGIPGYVILTSDYSEGAAKESLEAMHVAFRVVADAAEKKAEEAEKVAEETEKEAVAAARRRVNELFEERYSKSGPGKWKQSQSTSPIDDSPTVVLRLNAEKAVTTKWGSHRPTLIVRCQQNQTNVYLSWDFFLGTDSIRVTTRLDKEPASTKAWSISTNNQATFSPAPIPLTKSLWSHNTLFVQLTPYGESSVNTTFDLRGLASQVWPLREACHW